MLTRLAFLFLAMISLVGCGARPQKSADRVYPLSSSMRILGPGDEWTYHENMTFHSSFQDYPVTSHADTRRTVVRVNLQGQPSMAIAEGQHYSTTHLRGGVDARNHALLYIKQAKNGEITEVADTAPTSLSMLGMTFPSSATSDQGAEDDPQWRADMPTNTIPPRIATWQAVILPGSFHVGLTNNYRLVFDSGDEEDAGMEVTGKETVRTPAGTFETYRVEWTKQYSDATPPADATQVPQPAQPSIMHATEWWAPELGSPVKEQISVNSSMPGLNMRYRATETLEQTNVLAAPGACP